MQLIRSCLLTFSMVLVIASCSSDVGDISAAEPEATETSIAAAPVATAVVESDSPEQEPPATVEPEEQEPPATVEPEEQEPPATVEPEEQEPPATVEPEEPEVDPSAADAELTEPEVPEPDPTNEAESAPIESEPLCGVAVTIAFIESAPRDRMTITNNSAAASFATVQFDLTNSVGEVIFDTLDGGAGVEVFQDFQAESGDATLAEDPAAEDGASVLRLDFDTFAAGQSFTFSIDVDDQLTDSDLGQIQVSGAELAGAAVVLTTDSGNEITALFDESDVAQVASDC